MSYQYGPPPPPFSPWRSPAQPPQEPVVSEVTQVVIEQTLAPLTGGRFTDKCPWPAMLTSICLHFPPGCNALVDVAAGHSGKQCFPQQGFIALDAATPIFPVAETLNAGELLWAEIRNGDAINPHNISVIFTLQRRA